MTTHQRSTHTTSATPAHKSSEARGTAHDAFAMLIKDHRKVQKMFKDFDKLDDADAAKKKDIVRHTCQELTIHATLEEEIIYPAMREVLKDEDMVDEAYVEHAVAKSLIALLKDAEPSADFYDAQFTVLGELINHHIEEEESDLFKKVKSKLDADALGQQMTERKQALLQELGGR